MPSRALQRLRQVTEGLEGVVGGRDWIQEEGSWRRLNHQGQAPPGGFLQSPENVCASFYELDSVFRQNGGMNHPTPVQTPDGGAELRFWDGGMVTRYRTYDDSNGFTEEQYRETSAPTPVELACLTPDANSIPMSFDDSRATDLAYAGAQDPAGLAPTNDGGSVYSANASDFANVSIDAGYEVSNSFTPDGTGADTSAFATAGGPEPDLASSDVVVT